MEKPPTQVAGVVGIDATPITMNTQPERIDWRAVVALPPFQMFAAERMRNTSGCDSEEHARQYVRAQGAGADLLERYAAWHSAKGYWPNETLMGEYKHEE